MNNHIYIYILLYITVSYPARQGLALLLRLALSRLSPRSVRVQKPRHGVTVHAKAAGTSLSVYVYIYIYTYAIT